MKKKRFRENIFKTALARFLTNEKWTKLTVPVFSIVLTLIAFARERSK